MNPPESPQVLEWLKALVPDGFTGTPRQLVYLNYYKVVRHHLEVEGFTPERVRLELAAADWNAIPGTDAERGEIIMLAHRAAEDAIAGEPGPIVD
jgi:hypothetical protein